jgi:hypothetical protein
MSEIKLFTFNAGIATEIAGEADSLEKPLSTSRHPQACPSTSRPALEA